MNRSFPKVFPHTKTSIPQAISKKIQKLCKNQSSKPLRTLTLNAKNIQSKIIQTTFLDLKVCQNQAQKLPETSRNHILAKLYGFKPPKASMNFHHKPSKTKNKEQEEYMKNAKNKEFLSNLQSDICCNSVSKVFDLFFRN